MNYKKTLIVVGLLGMLCLIFPVTQIWAGGGPEEPTDGTIQGPEVWATVIVDCTNASVYIRAKRIVDCNVEKQAMMFSLTLACPEGMNEETPLYERYGISGGLFDIMGEPIITKVKNFQHDIIDNVNLYTFDAQIKFFIPNQ